MTIRWVTVTLGTKRPDNTFGASVAHGTAQANDITIAWDDTTVTTKDHLAQGVRIALNQAMGTLKS